MCMLIYHPSNAKTFKQWEFADFHRKNPHGFGVMWRAGDALHHRRGLWQPDASYALYRRLLQSGVREMALHWRLATKGAVGVANCHPVPVCDGMLLMHNGASIGPSTADKSDTVVFAKNVLSPILGERPWLIHMPEWTKKLEDGIGAGNRLILWDEPDRNPVVVGESRGLWHKGRWYSNTYAWTMPRAGKRYWPAPAKKRDDDYSEFLSGWDYASR